MKSSLKTAGIALVLSSVSMLVAAVNILVCALNGLPMWSAITIMLCMIAIFFANLSLYSKKKKERHDGK
jgi:uncharacterized membrane protein YhaH (DUF805 family)